MAYMRKTWQDHVVSRPRTYNEQENADGSKTFTQAGSVVQQGTPLSAGNLNRQEEMMMDYSVAFDMLATMLGSLQMEVEAMKEQLNALV